MTAAGCLIAVLTLLCLISRTKHNMCTDLKKFPHLQNNYTVGGSLVLSKLVGGLLHCVEECKLLPSCLAFTYNTVKQECSMYPLFGYSNTENTGPLIYSAINDWTRQASGNNSMRETTLRIGYDCYVMRGPLAFYNGTTTVTKSGYTCQRWDRQSPHSHVYGTEASDFETGETMDEVSNYCRVSVSDGTPTPWCYTITSKRWELCDIPECP